ncbi:MAG: hypothetical protein IJ563_00935 [Selenomonadaceae bacterium]|nr:hypothetical protein [Selenomonadaceae bacterium]
MDNMPLFRGKTPNGRLVQGGAYQIQYRESFNTYIVDHKGNEYRVDPNSIALATNFFDKNHDRIFIYDKIRFNHHLPNIDSVGTVTQLIDGLFVVNFPYLKNDFGVHVETLAQIAGQSTII